MHKRFVDKRENDVYGYGRNYWDNPFSNETSLIETDQGFSVVLGDNRRMVMAGGCPTYSVLGTEGSFMSFPYGCLWNYKVQPKTHNVVSEDVTEMLRTGDFDNDPHHVPRDMNAFTVDAPFKIDYDISNDNPYKSKKEGLSKVLNHARLPKAYFDIHNDITGAIPFLVDDFVKAVTEHKLPPIHAWRAASYCAPAVCGQESALRGGVQMKVPDFGNPGPQWGYVNPDEEFAKNLNLTGSRVEGFSPTRIAGK